MYTKPKFIRSVLLALTTISTAISVNAQLPSSSLSDIHTKLMVLDTHLDTPILLEQADFNIMHEHGYAHDFSQVDVPRMNRGGLDGGFWVIYTAQGPVTKQGFKSARDTALLRALAIHKMIAQNPDTFALATQASDAREILSENKKIVYVSMENAYPLGEDLSLLETFYKLGLRMVGPVHFKNNQFGDSSTDPDGQQWHGISPLGKELVKEANRLGIILDGSHAHDDLVEAMIELSETPIILSHTGTKHVYDHPRNIDDALLKKLVKSGGVLHVNAYGGYLTELPDDPERNSAYKALREQFGDVLGLDSNQLKQYKAARRSIDLEHPAVRATFADYMDHFLHILKVAGPKHVGVGADWDGGGGVAEMMDVAALPLITERLIKEGYSEQDLADIWGNNVLRLLDQAKAYADQLKQNNN